MQTETVEIVTLLPPMAEHGYVTVTMYIDDRGIARALPRNDRATSLMHTVSNRAGPILGDAFLGYAAQADLLSLSFSHGSMRAQCWRGTGGGRADAA